jgi:hypothetical protein
MADTHKRKPRNPGPLPPAGEALAEVLKTNGKMAQAIKKRFHRTMLWRWKTGRGTPDLHSAPELQKLSRGRVRADGWTVVQVQTEEVA